MNMLRNTWHRWTNVRLQRRIQHSIARVHSSTSESDPQIDDLWRRIEGRLDCDPPARRGVWFTDFFTGYGSQVRLVTTVAALGLVVVLLPEVGHRSAPWNLKSPSGTQTMVPNLRLRLAVLDGSGVARPWNRQDTLAVGSSLLFSVDCSGSRTASSACATVSLEAYGPAGAIITLASDLTVADDTQMLRSGEHALAYRLDKVGAYRIVLYRNGTTPKKSARVVVDELRVRIE